MWRDIIENVAEMGLRAWIFGKCKSIVWQKCLISDACQKIPHDAIRVPDCRKRKSTVEEINTKLGKHLSLFAFSKRVHRGAPHSAPMNRRISAMIAPDSPRHRIPFSRALHGVATLPDQTRRKENLGSLDLFADFFSAAISRISALDSCVRTEV